MNDKIGIEVNGTVEQIVYDRNEADCIVEEIKKEHPNYIVMAVNL